MSDYNPTTSSPKISTLTSCGKALRVETSRAVYCMEASLAARFDCQVNTIRQDSIGLTPSLFVSPQPPGASMNSFAVVNSRLTTPR